MTISWIFKQAGNHKINRKVMEYYKDLDLADIEYFCEYNFIWKI